MTIEEAQNQVDNWIKTVGVRYFGELTNMAILTEEVGELARIMARKYGDQSFKESDKNADLSDEMAVFVANSFFLHISLKGFRKVYSCLICQTNKHPQHVCHLIR